MLSFSTAKSNSMHLCAYSLCVLYSFSFVPHSYVEEDVDYNSGNDGLYAKVNKKKPDYNENAPTSGVPCTIHQVGIMYSPKFIIHCHLIIKLIQLFHP